MVDTASAAQRDLTDLTDDQCNEFRRLPLSFNDMVRAIYRAGASRPAVQQEGWRPIETAPRLNGQRVLLLRDGGGGAFHAIGYALDGVPGWCSNECRGLQTLEELGYRVTHWMPLPERPNLSPATPRPEDVSQKAGKDATYWHDRYCTEKKERKDWQERAEEQAGPDTEAIRREALEEAAKVCESKHANGNWKYDHRDECASAIRAIAATGGSK